LPIPGSELSTKIGQTTKRTGINKLFCDVDDFCSVFIPQWQQQLLADGERKRAGRITASEIMTIIIAFHISHHQDFKNFYTGNHQSFYRKKCPQILRYTRFLEMMPSVHISEYSDQSIP